MVTVSYSCNNMHFCTILQIILFSHFNAGYEKSLAHSRHFFDYFSSTGPEYQLPDDKNVQQAYPKNHTHKAAGDHAGQDHRRTAAI